MSITALGILFSLYIETDLFSIYLNYELVLGYSKFFILVFHLLYLLSGFEFLIYTRYSAF